ncbi:MAG: hypothetical protein Q7R87_04435 [Nanoarchaeota archaeon]|nr:hypothetical protein [Nanoarchaeota archaeon]
MAEKDILIREKAEYTGVFDYSEAYSYFFEWFKDDKYLVVEEKHNEKIKPDGKEIIIEWKARRELTDYFLLQIDVKFEVKRMVDVEVEIEGKKKKMNKGFFKVELKGILVRDPKSIWETTPLYKFLRDVYNKYIIAGRVDQMEDRVKEDTIAFKEAFKSFLDFSGKRNSPYIP